MSARFTLVAFVLLLNCGASALDAIDVQQVAGRSRGLACVAGDADAIAEALARDGSFLVHQLIDSAKVGARRRAAEKAGLLGKLIVEERRGAVLPYPDRFLDLLVIAPDGAVAEAERQRVLAVDGLALLADGTTWQPKPDKA